MNALWFSRHQPTAAQVAEIEARGYTLVAIEEGMRLGAIPINSTEQVQLVWQDLVALARAGYSAHAVFGVFPVPLAATWLKAGTVQACDGLQPIPTYGAWNVQRSTEGGRPTFCHKEWMHVGFMPLDVRL